MLAADGSFDQPVEQATAELGPGALDGARMVFVYARDADGNEGPPSAIWLPQDSLNFGNGFELPE